MIAVECCVKTDGFAAMDADELFFINGGSGNSGSGSYGSSITGGNITQSGNGSNIAISGVAPGATVSISITGSNNGQSVGNGNGVGSSGGGSSSGGGK